LQGEDTNPFTAISYARSVGGLDVFAVTDHVGFLTGEKWHDTQYQCAAQTEEGAFVALAGFEWAYGADHINVIGSRDFTTSARVGDLTQFYRWILDQALDGEGETMVCQFNHPGRTSYFSHFDDFAYNSAVDPYFALIELFSSEKPEYRKGSEQHEPWYIKALDQGWHVAPAGNQDNHYGRYGDVNAIRTGIWARGLTRAEIMEALRARRTFASEDRHTSLQFHLNGQWMGSTLPEPPGELSTKCLHFQIQVEGPQGVQDLLILSRGGRIVWSNHRPSRDQTTWNIDLSYIGASYYFAKVRLEDGALLYSAPIWVPGSAAGFVAPLTLPRGLSLIALPLVPDQDDPQKLFGFSHNRWASWDPTVGDYVRYPQPWTWFDSHTPGRAYWILLDQPTTVSVAGTPVDPQTPFAIALKRGWNQIGNPFLGDVKWDFSDVRVRRGADEKTLEQAQQAGWIECCAWGWKQEENNPNRGVYVLISDPTVIPGVQGWLEPWQGYWVKVQEDCALILPPSEETAPPPSKASFRPQDGRWTVQIVARTGDGFAATVMLGVTPRLADQGCETGLRAALPPPPPTGVAPTRAFLIDPTGQPLAVDLRSNCRTRQTWELVVEPGSQSAGTSETSGPPEVTLTWPTLGRTGPSNASLILVDRTTGAERSLGITSHYTYRPSRGETHRRFQIMVEPRPEPALQITSLQATRRPGSERGILIAFHVNRSADTKVTVSTLTGRVVSQVEPVQTRAAGWQQVVWAGRDESGRPVPPGAYLVEVVAWDGEGPPARAVRVVRIP